MSSSNFASFAPYAPPPDENTTSQSSNKSTVRPWFPSHASSYNDTSYQSGGIPTFTGSVAGGVGAAEESEAALNLWETRYGARVDILAAVAYLLGPLTALTLLIIETTNDYVRFHAYQSALLTTPLVLFRIFASIAHFPGWIRTFLTLLLICSQLYMAAYFDAAHSGLSRYHLPFIGQLAEQWLTEE